MYCTIGVYWKETQIESVLYCRGLLKGDTDRVYCTVGVYWKETQIESVLYCRGLLEGDTDRECIVL